MSASIWIINLVVLAAVLEADLGHRKITRSRLIRPLVIAAVIAAFWISGIAGSGTGLWVELADVGTGIVLGLVAAALMRVYADGGRWYSYAAVPYALLWVAVVGARPWFAYAANRDIRVPVGTWMYAHRLTTSALVDAFIFLALAMVLTRTGPGQLPDAPADRPAASTPAAEPATSVRGAAALHLCRGCISYRFNVADGGSPLLESQASGAVGFMPRTRLVSYVKNTEGLAPCGRGASCPG